MKVADISHPILRDVVDALPADQGERLAGLLGSREIPAGEILFREGEAVGDLFFILSGGLAVHKKSGFGGKTKAVALLREGSVVGEAAMLREGSHGSDVVAVRDSRILVLEKADLEVLETDNPALYLQLLKKMLKISSLRLKKSSERLALIL